MHSHAVEHLAQISPCNLTSEHVMANVDEFIGPNARGVEACGRDRRRASVRTADATVPASLRTTLSLAFRRVFATSRCAMGTCPPLDGPRQTGSAKTI